MNKLTLALLAILVSNSALAVNLDSLTFNATAFKKNTKFSSNKCKQITNTTTLTPNTMAFICEDHVVVTDMDKNIIMNTVGISRKEGISHKDCFSGRCFYVESNQGNMMDFYERTYKNIIMLNDEQGNGYFAIYNKETQIVSALVVWKKNKDEFARLTSIDCSKINKDMTNAQRVCTVIKSSIN